MASSEYDYEYGHLGETIQLGVGCAGVACEPQVRWQVGDRSGEHGYVSFDASKPVVRLEEGETARLGGQVVTELPVSRDIGEALQDAYETLGTIVPERDRIGTDPAVFPPEIADFERLGWESARNVMWYWRDDRASPRAYQIERGELVFRTQEWSDDANSQQELIDQYGLDTAYRNST
jgi:hypothetical protein